MKNLNRYVKPCNILCAVLMLLLIVCQFLPFWSANGDSASLQSLTWFPDNHKQLQSRLKAQMEESFVLQDIVLPSILILLLGAFGVCFSLWKVNSAGNGLLSLLCGLCGIWGYLANPIYQLGNGWVFHLVLSFLIAALSIIPIIQYVKNIISWFKN